MTRTRPWPLRPALAVALLTLLAPTGRGAEAAAARHVESEARLRRDVTYLASPELEGRGPLTRGIDLAAEYIAAEFKKAGLRPGMPDGSWFQPFTIPGATLEGPARLVLKGPLGQVIELKQGVHFQPFGMGHPGKLTAPAAFAGYGVTAGKESNYDDYQGLDAAGKVVFVLRDLPRAGARTAEAAFEPARRRQLASFSDKLVNAEQHKAAAVLFVNDAETARTGDELLDFHFTALARSTAKLPAFHVRRSVLEAMLRTAGAELSDLERAIDASLKPHSRDLAGWTVTLELPVKRDRVTLRNVVGVLEGSGPLASETVVVGAHYDHLGYGGPSSTAGLKKMAVHHGADDNASGTTGLLELARRFGAIDGRQGRRLVFIAFSGEELGLYGSDHYCKQPLYPLGGGAARAAAAGSVASLARFAPPGTVAMFNLDMIGRLRPDEKARADRLLVEGSGTARTFDELLDRLAPKHGFVLTRKGSGAGPSDHASFYARRIPVLFFWTGYHDDYHKPSDTADKINVAGLRRVVDLGEEVVSYLATVEPRPEFVEVKGPAGTSPSMGPRLGIEVARDDQPGVLVGAVLPGEPADKAGIRKGDRIVELAGRPIKALENLLAELANQRAGSTVEIGLVRDGQKLTVKAELPFVPRLGIRPSYTDDKEGVLLDGVSDGQPAALAGLKAGDRIIGLGGQPVKDLEGYMRALPGAVKGDSVEVLILRDGKKLPVKIKVR